MAEKLSTLDSLRADAIAHAAERITTVLRAQGVGHVRALEFVESEVMLRVGAGLSVYAEARGVQSRGSSDASLVWFAREVHISNPDLGGTPKPFGFETPPAFDGEVEEAARSTAQHAAWDATREHAAETQAGIVHATQAAEVAAAVAKHAASINGAF